MLVFEFKLKATPSQKELINDAIRTARFIRNSCLRYWMDGDREVLKDTAAPSGGNGGSNKIGLTSDTNSSITESPHPGAAPAGRADPSGRASQAQAQAHKKINRYSLNKYTKVLADHPDFPWAKKLNSMARQASAELAWFAISRFFDNCKKADATDPSSYGGSHAHQAEIPGKKGYPRFKKNSRSVEYKTSGWSLSNDKKYLTMTDKFNIGKMKLIGSRDLHFYDQKLIKRVRLIRRADGFYAQFSIDVERNNNIVSTGKTIGIDLGLNHFYTDSNNNKLDNPKFLRKSLKLLKKRQRQVSKKKKGSPKGYRSAYANRRKAVNRLARKHLKVSRQRKDFVVKTARTLCTSNDVIVLENLNVRGLVKNHKLALSISDASWSIFREWLEYFGTVMDREIIAVDPKFTTQDCSNCGNRIQKSLSTRTHQCSCGAVLCRDHNAAINILNKGTGGQSETTPIYEDAMSSERDGALKDTPSDKVSSPDPIEALEVASDISAVCGVDASGQMTLWCADESLITKVAG